MRLVTVTNVGVGAQFPFLLGGTFIEAQIISHDLVNTITGFPFLLGGTFIEAQIISHDLVNTITGFPFLLGGTFIEARGPRGGLWGTCRFPFLLGGTFIEAPATLQSER